MEGAGAGPEGGGAGERADPDRPGRLVSVAIGVTVAPSQFSTYAVRPSGAIAIARGSRPTGIGRPARLVAVATGVTVAERSSAT
jgi:hypothetical protein